MMTSSEMTIQSIISKHNADPGLLLQILIDTQDHLGWISPETAHHIAQILDIAPARVISVVEFYTFLYDQPVGRYRILFSDNITDRMQGSVALRNHMLRRLKTTLGKVSPDGLASVDITSCTGMCDQGPALLINGRPIVGLTTRKIDEICDLVRASAPLAEWPAHYFKVSDNIRRADALLGSPHVPGKALQAAIARGPQGVIDEVKESNLRGRGGAGFTTGVKWEACRLAPGEQRYVVCNADEGEPGTFKDRVLLNSFAERIFEGMAIAGYAVGATKGYVYLRGEYRYLLPKLNSLLEGLRQQKLLGTGICGVRDFDFDIDIHLGAGAYICGEETALIESLEGKPGRPRIRPPFPVTCGYNNQPTVVNNVETLCKATEIMLQGGRAYAMLGTKQSTGTKLLSVSGDCERPGVYEYPFGVRISTVLEDCGAPNSGAVQISGAAGTCLAPAEFGRRIAFEDVATAGSFMAFNKSRDIFDVARNFCHFFAHESCGFCTPCRVGTSLVKDIIDKVAEGHGSRYEINELLRLREVMRTSSHCGLGQTATNALGDMMQKFRGAFDRRLIDKDFEPAFNLRQATERAREVAGREHADSHLEAEDQ